MDEKIFSKYFKAFGDRSRIKILRLLASREMTVGDITKKIGLSQPTVSRHLSILREADIVNNRRDGQQVFYSLNKTSVSNCCVGFCDCLVVPVTAFRKKSTKQ